MGLSQIAVNNRAVDLKSPTKAESSRSKTCGKVRSEVVRSDFRTRPLEAHPGDPNDEASVMRSESEICRKVRENVLLSMSTESFPVAFDEKPRIGGAREVAQTEPGEDPFRAKA